MGSQDVVYGWERLPEYRSTQQLGRCIGRILVSLPPRLRRTLGRTLIRGPVLIAQGIAGSNAEMPPDEPLSVAQRETFRRATLEAIEVTRDALRLMKARRVGSLPDIMVGVALLDRIESGVQRRVPQG